MEKILEQLLEQLTIEDKAALLSQIVWETTELPINELKNFLLADGPSGIRRLKEYFDEDIYNTLPTTCYPSASAYASSWNRRLLRQLGNHLGLEAKSMGVDVLLGPGVNLKRSPLGGRNFEYYSEDPYLTGELATEYILGLQEAGTGACLKHFAANNQETRRMTINAVIDEVTLCELYLRAFEKPVKVGKPWMVMAAYNQVNGEYCAENEFLLSDILRKGWEYKGVVVTDCFAAHDLSKGILRGLNLQMPGETGQRLAERIHELLQAGEITENDLDNAISKTILLSEKIQAEKKQVDFDRERHHRFAEQVAEESIVLLKNDNSVLPLCQEECIAVIGEMAAAPRFQGGGSSHVNPWKLENALEAMKGYGHIIGYAAGYHEDSTDEALLKEAESLAGKADKAVLFLGLPEIYESEGYDRTDLAIPAAHIELLERVYLANREIIVVLSNGAPVEMPWIDKVKGVLEAYLPGEAGGPAISKILYGQVNPSGHLAETFPIVLADTPAYLNFPGGMKEVCYSEGELIGYRYYDKAGKKVRFPFGHGLSYTTFAYSGFQLEQKSGDIYVKVSVQNAGQMAGYEVVQVYAGTARERYRKPVKVLAGFDKVWMEPGDTRELTLELDKKAFQSYHPETHSWENSCGIYTISVGRSVEEILWTQDVETGLEFPGPKSQGWQIDAHTCLGDMICHSDVLEILREEFASHPKSLQFLELAQMDNPLQTSMGGLMSFQNLKRTDDTLKDGDIRRIIEKINQYCHVCTCA